MLKKNVGTADRIIPALIGVAAIYAYFNVESAYGWVFLVVAAIGFVTAVASSCPVYSILGLRTCKVENS